MSAAQSLFILIGGMVAYIAVCPRHHPMDSEPVSNRYKLDAQPMVSEDER